MLETYRQFEVTFYFASGICVSRLLQVKIARRGLSYLRLFLVPVVTSRYLLELQVPCMAHKNAFFGSEFSARQHRAAHLITWTGLRNMYRYFLNKRLTSKTLPIRKIVRTIGKEDHPSQSAAQPFNQKSNKGHPGSIDIIIFNLVNKRR